MATRLDCHTAPSGGSRCSPGREGDHDSRNFRPRILDFQQIAKTTWGEPGALATVGLGGAPTKSGGGAPTETGGQVTTLARRFETVARPGEAPQCEHAGSPCVPARSGAASGKESPMGKHRRPVIADESHESAKKNLTRQRRHTLRSHPSSENAGTQRAFILIHGATDASGR
jgi:hypothetical protein